VLRFSDRASALNIGEVSQRILDSTPQSLIVFRLTRQVEKRAQKMRGAFIVIRVGPI